MKWKDLSFEQQQKYGRLAYCYLQQLAEKEEYSLDLDSSPEVGWIEIDYTAHFSTLELGVKDRDPAKNTFRTVHEGYIEFNGLDIEFPFNIETPY